MTKKQIKLTVTDDMFNSLKERSQEMSLSVPSLCNYFIAEKLYQIKLAESVSIDSVKNVLSEFTSSQLEEFKKNK